jgi:hypothetical protein
MKQPASFLNIPHPRHRLIAVRELDVGYLP